MIIKYTASKYVLHLPRVFKLLNVTRNMHGAGNISGKGEFFRENIRASLVDPRFVYGLAKIPIARLNKP